MSALLLVTDSAPAAKVGLGFSFFLGQSEQIFWEEEVVVPGFVLSDSGNVESCAWAVFPCLQRFYSCTQDVVPQGLAAVCLRLCCEG